MRKVPESQKLCIYYCFKLLGLAMGENGSAPRKRVAKEAKSDPKDDGDSVGGSRVTRGRV